MNNQNIGNHSQSIPQPGMQAKFAVLWATNKPLAIAIIAGILLLVSAIIFLIVYFLVLSPGQAAGPVENKPSIAASSDNTLPKPSNTSSGTSGSITVKNTTTPNTTTSGSTSGTSSGTSATTIPTATKNTTTATNTTTTSPSASGPSKTNTTATTTATSSKTQTVEDSTSDYGFEPIATPVKAHRLGYQTLRAVRNLMAETLTI